MNQYWTSARFRQENEKVLLTKWESQDQVPYEVNPTDVDNLCAKIWKNSIGFAMLMPKLWTNVCFLGCLAVAASP